MLLLGFSGYIYSTPDEVDSYTQSVNYIKEQKKGLNVKVKVLHTINEFWLLLHSTFSFLFLIHIMLLFLPLFRSTETQTERSLSKFTIISDEKTIPFNFHRLSEQSTKQRELTCFASEQVDCCNEAMMKLLRPSHPRSIRFLVLSHSSSFHQCPLHLHQILFHHHLLN